MAATVVTVEPILLGSLTGPGWYRGSDDPTTGAGVPAALGSLYSRDNGTVWWKSSAPDTGWTVIPTGDGWTNLVTSADFTTGSGSLVAVAPGSGQALTFQPVATATYAVEGQLIISSLNAGVAPQAGIIWPTGLTAFGGGVVQSTNTITGLTYGANTQGTNVQTNTASVPTNLDGYLALISATFNTGVGPGTFSAAVESETGGTDVAVRAGSWIRYRRMQ